MSDIPPQNNPPPSAGTHPPGQPPRAATGQSPPTSPNEPTPVAQAAPQPVFAQQVLPHLLLAGALRGSPLGAGSPIPIPIPLTIPAAQTQQVVQLWQGQYPPPDAVEHYEKVLPGSFDRMIAMAERLQAAQIDESRRVHDYAQADSKRGHWLGAGSAVLAMLCALGALALGNPWVACAFISVPVMGVAKALVESTRKPSATELLAAAAGTQPGLPQSTPPAASVPSQPPAPQTSS